MLLALMQSVGMGGGSSAAVVLEQAGGKANRPPRKRRYRDEQWKRDYLYATKELQRELTEAAKGQAPQTEIYESEAEEAAELVAESVDFVGGGLFALPQPPESVARAIVDIPAEQPNYREIISAIKESRKHERDTTERKRISVYQGLVMAAHRRAMALRDDDEALLAMEFVL